MSEDTILTQQMLEKFSSDFHKRPNCQVLKNAIIKNGIKNVTLNNNAVINLQKTFSEEITTGKITAQEHSGRCWLFAGMNVLRQRVAKNINIESFELSQNYPMFWDKLEKANFFLDNIIETIDEDIYSRTVMWLLTAPCQDGGQWDMFSNLVEKYGVVPKYVMPESHHSANSKVMNDLLTLKLRESASILRKAYQNGESLETVQNRKTGMLSEIYRMLSYFLGEPPKTFNFEYRDKDKIFHQDISITPTGFFDKYVKLNLDDYVSIINAPTDDKPFNKTYTVQYLGNVRGGKDILYLNVVSETLKHLAVSQLKDREVVWFGCDVGKMMERDVGILDREAFLYEEAFDMKFDLDKAGRLDYGESKLTHAMVFTGVNLIKGKPNRWKVENSWGEKAGQEGFLIMNDNWFDEYNFQVVINKKYLSADLKAALKQKPIVLPPWDPMGSLAGVR
ncbi:MAG: C1 family peptidase [Candidatus Hatepunaea meridiana]|nr:C1 family peptidase [Candidatus Hatepunaea meridiana]